MTLNFSDKTLLPNEIDELKKKYPFAFNNGIAKPYLDVEKEIDFHKLSLDEKIVFFDSMELLFESPFSGDSITENSLYSKESIYFDYSKDLRFKKFKIDIKNELDIILPKYEKLNYLNRINLSLKRENKYLTPDKKEYIEQEINYWRIHFDVSNNANDKLFVNIEWKKDKNDLIELIHALWKTDSIYKNGEKVNFKDLIPVFEKMFNIELKNPHDQLKSSLTAYKRETNEQFYTKELYSATLEKLEEYNKK